MARNRHGTRIGPSRPADLRSYFTCGDRNHGTAENQILRINANEATLNELIVQNIASFSQNYHNLNSTLSSRQASLAYGEADIILTHVVPSEGRIIRKKVGDLCVRAYRNVLLEAPTTGWIATAHGVDEAVETSDIFAEFGDMPQFTLHSLEMTVEVI